MREWSFNYSDGKQMSGIKQNKFDFRRIRPLSPVKFQNQRKIIHFPLVLTIKSCEKDADSKIETPLNIDLTFGSEEIWNSPKCVKCLGTPGHFSRFPTSVLSSLNFIKKTDNQKVSLDQENIPVLKWRLNKVHIFRDGHKILKKGSNLFDVT